MGGVFSCGVFVVTLAAAVLLSLRGAPLAASLAAELSLVGSAVPLADAGIAPIAPAAASPSTAVDPSWEGLCPAAEAGSLANIAFGMGVWVCAVLGAEPSSGVAAGVAGIAPVVPATA